MKNEEMTKHQIIGRIAGDLAIFFLVLFLPWWSVCIFCFLGAAFYSNFYEAFFFGLLLDALYGTEAINFHGFRLFFATAALFFIFFSTAVKQKMRFFS
ncbi:MAG: hypothetical protein NTZ13_04255 [Candidatus Parcubacteria bacterium]|nr:hypothetical protein [Candidatus Parcubacteria bacterium]